MELLQSGLKNVTIGHSQILDCNNITQKDIANAIYWMST